MRHDMNNVIAFSIFYRPEVLQENCCEDVPEIVRGEQESIEIS